MNDIIVSMHDICKSFPGVKALDHVDFELRSGEVMALLGENGAGKSTLMKVLSGVYTRDSGDMEIQGKAYGNLTPKQAQAAGVAIIHQELNMCRHLTVAENMFLGREKVRGVVLNQREMEAEAAEVLGRLKIDISPRTVVGDLPISKQQMVEIAKALSMDARILIMDEPTSALTAREIEDLFRIIRDLRASDHGIVYISHRLEELQHIVDRVTIMRDGQYITTMNFADTTIDQIITLLLAYFNLVLGELVPKRIAMHHPEKISLMVAPIIRFVFTISKPFVAVLSASTNLVLRLFGISADDQPEQVTEEEIRMMVDVGNEEGSIEKDEADMIDNIFEFDDITVEDVMTHRTDVAAVENTATVMDVIQLAIDKGYSRIPVYEDDIDNIVGIVYAKDMLRCITETVEQISNQPILPFIRKAIFVPESNRCSDLFKTFKEKKTQMAIVVDEYGGTSGIVTMEDLLESIVGNMQDEYDQEEEEYQKLSDTIFVLDGSMSVDDVEELLGMNIGPEEDYDTLSGMITDLLDCIPAKDEHPSVQVGNVKFTVLATDERRIAKLRAEILPVPEQTDEE